MGRNARYTTEQIEMISAKLREMPPAEKKEQKHSKYETIIMLKREIEGLQKRGYGLDQVADALRGYGIEITTPTLKNYLQRAKEKQREKRAAKPTKPTPAIIMTRQGQESSAKVATGTFEAKPDVIDI
jgi:acetolactate synthase small subunit